MPRYYDNTRIQDSQFCDLRFYYRHRRHWVPVKIEPAPAFGLGIHKGMDVIWAGIGKGEKDDAKLTTAAFLAFEKDWMENGFPALDDMTPEDHIFLRMRTPGTAINIFAEYIAKRRQWIEECEEIIALEHPFAIPLDPNNPDLWYIGRIDKEVRRHGRVYLVEHKTTSLYKKDGFFRFEFTEGFKTDSQIDGYTHYGRYKYKEEEFGEVLIDAILVHPNVHDGFALLPYPCGEAKLNAWLWETHQRIKNIESNDTRLSLYRKTVEDGTAHMGFMPAFPKRTTSCFNKFGACPYLKICTTVDNPETYDTPPMGYKEEKWEPFKLLKLEGLGMEPEQI